MIEFISDYFHVIFGTCYLLESITLVFILTKDFYLAWTMSSQLVVHNLNNGKLLNQIRYQDGILGQRFGQIYLNIYFCYFGKFFHSDKR